MIVLHEVQQEMYLDTPKGKSRLFAIIYLGIEASIKFLCISQDGGEIWEIDQTEARAEKNWTIGRSGNVYSLAPHVCKACLGLGKVLPKEIGRFGYPPYGKMPDCEPCVGSGAITPASMR